ncbi:MAG: cytochrome c family protein [Deltaproteobacteria bacterium]|nr:cytochrome c family protein [Deltaproteobacteria bacterium]
MPTRRSFGLFFPSSLFLALVTLVPQPALAVPTEPNELANPLFQAVDCQNCHTFNNAMGQDDQPLYAPFYGWQGSLMANAARDPVFWAGVALADQDEPGETIDCVRCHSPRAFLEGRGNAISIDELQPQDLEGVSCELCHRMTDQGEIGNARYAVDDVPGVGGLVPRHGPWEYAMGEPGPPHDWVFDPFTGSSQLCGTCHDVTTSRERLADDGTPLGFNFNEQRTYSEWANSSFAQPGMGFQSCQDCHMPAVADVPGCNQLVDMSSHATGGRRHDLVGANRFMVELLQAEYGNQGTGDIPDFFFNQTLDRMDEFIATAATLEVEGPAEVHLGEGLEGLAATVTNNTGHKLPSGYSEGRIMWLEVIATYGDQTVWTSGQWMEGVGPQDDDQLRSYQGVADELATGISQHLLLNDHWVEDTRIPPLGLVEDIQTDPVGSRYTLGNDGTWPNFDVAEYAFEGLSDVVDVTPDDATDDMLQIDVRLLYLINTPDYIQLLADDNRTNEAGSEVAMLFETMGGAPPIVLAEDSVTVPIVGFGEPPSSSTGADSTAGNLTGGNDTAVATDSAGTMGSTATDAGPGQDDDDGGGCACSSRDDSQRGAWWLLVPMGLVARRRRLRARA